MRIPKKVKVGGHWYKVHIGYIFKERFDRSGDTDSDIKEIRIAKETLGVPLPKSQVEQVFIHEILHAIDWVYNSDELEEKQIKRLAEGLYQVLKDNKMLK